ncbi:hypothetical protein ACSBR2_011256 [Camellia fascicularis]
MAETAVFHLLANFAPFLQQEAHLLTGVRNEIEYIRDEFNRMMSFLRVADAIEENDPELKVWVKQVREAAYDIGDVLDLFMLRLGHRHGHGFCGFLHKVSYFIKTSIARHQIASEVQRMKSKVNNISKGHQRYHDRYGMLEQGSSSRSTGFNKAWHDCRGDALLLDEAELVGIDEPKSQLITWLVHEDPRLKVLSLSGMGGLGKTTLVKKVFDDAVVKKHFQNHAWITVSESFNIKELLKGMIQQLFEEVRLSVPQGVEYMNTNSLKGIIKAFLQQKRNADLASFSSKEYHGDVYNLQPLPPKESWTLFCRKTFMENSCPSYLEWLSRAILKRCEGLPLAIVAISGLLSTKDNNVDEWDKINRSLGAELGGNDKLLRMTIEEVAEGYLNELINRSIVQVAQMRSDGRVQTYRIHDLWHEIIVSKSGEQNIVTIAGEQKRVWPEKVRRLSIHNHLENTQQSKCFTRLRSLLMFNATHSLSMLALSNDGLQLLTVLELRGAFLETFPNEVLKLLQLRSCSFHSFSTPLWIQGPTEIGSLSSLQTLCSIETNHDNGTILLGEVGKLTQLRKLQIEKLRNEDGRVLCSSLEKLSNLRSLVVHATGEDEIIDLDSLSSPPQLLRTLYLGGSLHKVLHWIPSLHSLVRVIFACSKLRDVDPLESLQGLPNLVELQLHQTYEGEELYFKAGGFQRLVRLYLGGLKGLRSVKVEVGSMPHFKELTINECELVEELPSGFEHLTNLKTLYLADMSNGLISSLNKDLEGGNYWKTANIPEVWIGDTKCGYFEGKYL